MGMARRIIHVDMDEFFVAVEKLDKPSLRGKCILVGGDPKGRGVVSTASYEARQFGCHSAMPMVTAVELCPSAVVLPPRMNRYMEVSRQIFEILDRFSPAVEPLSIDEAFIDVTGCERLHGPAQKVAYRIQRAIRDELGLSASIGIGPNKFLAKLASDLQKPAGMVLITEKTVHVILDPLPVSKVWGVGPSAIAQLARLNIATIGQLRRADVELLRGQFGEAGEHFWQLANGIDDRPVVPDSRARSISSEQTFADDVGDMKELRRVLLGQVELVARRLRQHGLRAKTVTLKLRTGDFETLTRSRTLPGPVSSTEGLWQTVEELLTIWAQEELRPLRLIGVAGSQLVGIGGVQMSLFESEAERKHRRVDKAVDKIVDRFGVGAVGRAGGKK